MSAPSDIDHLKDFQEDIDAEDLAAGDDIGGEFVNSWANDHGSDVSSYHPSDSNDADLDVDSKPAAKTKSPKKGEKKRGADIGGAKNQVTLQKNTMMQFFRMTRS